MSNSVVAAKSGKFVEILGTKIHYIDEGQGEILLFLHGIPTSSYLWRNIIPSFNKSYRCIALDWPGMGKSEAPKQPYNIAEQVKYLSNFIQALKLNQVTLVLHGFGSIIGFEYATQQPEKVARIIFYEGYLGPIAHKKQLSLPLQHLNALLQNPETGKHSVLNSPEVINTIFNTASLKKLSKEVLQNYSAPFQSARGRELLWQYIQEAPFSDNEVTLHLISEYSKKLQKSSIPKLMIYTIPGFVTTIENVIWCRDHIPNTTVVDVGQGLHFAQEYDPKAFSKVIEDWLS